MRHNGGMCLQLTNSPALNLLRVAASSNPKSGSYPVADSPSGGLNGPIAGAILSLT